MEYLEMDLSEVYYCPPYDLNSLPSEGMDSGAGSGAGNRKVSRGLGKSKVQ